MSKRHRGGFTLVELLVVVGIIAVLVGILLPSLNRARDQARTTKCLSNLRSIGQGIYTYATENRGYLLPGWVAGEDASTRGLDNYATILAGLKYVPAPDHDLGWAADASEHEESVFKCPNGLEVKHERPDMPFPPYQDRPNRHLLLAPSFYPKRGRDMGTLRHHRGHLVLPQHVRPR